MFSEDLVDIKQEPPDEVDEDLASILNNDVQLMEISHDHKQVSTLISSEVTDLLSDENEPSDKTVDSKKEKCEGKTNGVRLKANLKCKFTFCDFRARKVSELERHEAKHSIPGSYYECKFCKFMTPVYQKLQEHEAKHTNSKPFKCRKCSYRSRYRADIYHHSAKHLADKKFKCPHEGCNFLTKWRRNIHHHVLTHTDDRPHECKICDYKFKRVQDLKYHLYRHNDLKPISCDECDFRCKTNYELGCHKLKHSTIRNYPCTFPGCPQRTKTKSDLTKHMKTHSKVRDHLCPICGKGFHMRNSLTRHIERHQDTRNYQCGLCSKSFKTKATLRAHMQVHSGIKPWTCNICSRDFLNKWNMMKHKETHGENRPFKCPICPYGARVGEHLLAHIGTMHGKSFAYYCEICKKPWKRFSQLQIHMKRMHKGALRSSFGSSMKMDIKLEPGVDGDIATGCDLISVKKIDSLNPEQFKHKRGRPPKIKKEPLDEVGTAVDEVHGCRDPVTDVVKAIASHQNTPTSTPTNPLLVQTKHEVPTDIGPAKIVSFGEFRLPLATKGFPFNYDKNGKKPNSWFMNPENMHGKAADKQQAYLEKKERDFERKYGRKLGWRRFRLRKKPKPEDSFTKVSDKEEEDEDLYCIKEETDDRSSHRTYTKKKVEGFKNTDGSKHEEKSNVNGKKTTKRKQDPMELLIEGRKKLILMRKIKRRQKRWKQRMAEIMPSEDYSFEGLRESGADKASVCLESLDDWTKPDEYQESVFKHDEESSDQDDDIPLSKLKNTEDLDDLPLSILRIKGTGDGHIVTKACRDLKPKTSSTSPSLSGRLSKQPPKPRRNKRQFQNTIVHKTKFGEKAKKRKMCQETAVVGTNFYSGSVRILSKTLVAVSQINESTIEKNREYKNTISSSANQSDSNLSRNGASLKLKGNKIENIVAKLKAKKFGSEFENMEIATEENSQGNIRKKVGRPKGSKNKVRVNHDPESECNSTVSHKSCSVMAAIEQSVHIQNKSRRGRPKGSKNKVKTDEVKTDMVKTSGSDNCVASAVEQHSVLKSMLQHIQTSSMNPVMSSVTLNTSVKSIKSAKEKCVEMSSSTVLKENNSQSTSSMNVMSGFTVTASVKPMKYRKVKCVENKVKDVGSGTVLQRKERQSNTHHSKAKKAGRPKGSKNRVSKKGYFQKTKSANLTPKAGLKKGRRLYSKSKSTGISRGTVCEVMLDKSWDLSKKINNPQHKSLNSLQCSQETQTKIHQPKKVRSAETIPVRLKSGKCKDAINFQLKNKLLDKIAKQKKRTKMSEEMDLGFSFPEQNKSLVSVSQNPIAKKKVGRPKGSKNKMGYKVLMSKPGNKTVMKLKSEKLAKSEKSIILKKSKQKKVKVIKGPDSKDTADDSSKTKKKTKIVSTKKQQTNLKVKLSKMKYKQNLKNRKTGSSKLLKEDKKFKKCLKMKVAKGNKKVSPMFKRKKFVCALGTIKAKSKNMKKPSEPKQIWYIDIERDNVEETTANMTLVKSEPTNSVFIEPVTPANLQVDKSLFLSEMTTENHIPNVVIKSEPKENLLKTETVLMSEFMSTVPYAMKSEDSEDVCIYLEHAKAWGVGQAADGLQPDGFTASHTTCSVELQVKEEMLQADDSTSSHIFPLGHQLKDHIQSVIDHVHYEPDADTESAIEAVVIVPPVNPGRSESPLKTAISVPEPTFNPSKSESALEATICVPEPNFNPIRSESASEATICVPEPNFNPSRSESALEANICVPEPNFNPSRSESALEATICVPEPTFNPSRSESALEATICVPEPNFNPSRSENALEANISVPEPTFNPSRSENALEATISVPEPNFNPSRSESALEATISVPKPNFNPSRSESALEATICVPEPTFNPSRSESALEATICVPKPTFNPSRSESALEATICVPEPTQDVNVDTDLFMIHPNCEHLEEKTNGQVKVQNLNNDSLMMSTMTDKNNGDPFTNSNTDIANDTNSLLGMSYSNSEMANVDNNVVIPSCSDSQMANMETSDLILGCSDLQMANIENSDIVLSRSNSPIPKVKNNDRVSSFSESLMQNNGPLPRHVNSEMTNIELENVFLSDPDENNSLISESNSQMENNGLASTDFNCELPNQENNIPDLSILHTHVANMEQDGLFLSPLNSEIKNDVLVSSPMNCVDDVNINANFNQTLSNCTETNDDRVIIGSDCKMENYNSEFIITHSDSEVGVSEVENDDHSIISLNGDVKVQKDCLLMTELYSQAVDKDCLVVTTTSNNIHTDDPCHDVATFSSHETDDELYAQMSWLHSVGDDLSFKVVLADSDIEQDLVSDVERCKSSATGTDREMFKPSIKTETGCLPENCAAVNVPQTVGSGSYSFSVVESGSQDGTACVVRGNEIADHSEGNGR